MEGIVAAGSTAPVALQELGIKRIPLLSIHGETLLARVCRCLVEGGGCARVFVLAPPDVPLPDMPQVSRAAYSGKIVSDMLDLLRVQAQRPYILLASGDMPLITPEAVAAVRQIGQASEADVVYPVCERSVIEQRFPGTKRTYLRTAGVSVSGGNVFWLNRQWILDQQQLLYRLFDNRKSPLGLARLFGFGFLLRIALGLSSLEWIEQRLGQVLQGKLRAAVLPFPELVVDLDKLKDFELFRRYLDDWQQE